MKLNHFPLRSDLAVFNTAYQHRNPRAFLQFVRHEGFTAEQVGEQVCVYHGASRPEFRGTVAGSSRRLDSEDPEFSRGISSIIRTALLRAGYVLADRGVAAIHPIQQRLPLQTPRHVPPEITVNAHLRWEWELERHSGQNWLVLRPGRTFLSGKTWESAALQAWGAALPERVVQLHALCLRSGRRERLLREEGHWVFSRPEREMEGLWHLSFSMKTLSDLNLSSNAHHSAALSMGDVRRLVQLPGLWQPFVTSLEPLDAQEQVIEGKRLKFRRGLGRDVTEVHKRGILTPPPTPVRLVVVPPDLTDPKAERQLRQELLAHLLPRDQVLRNADASEGLRKHLNRQDSDDTLHTFWSAGTYQDRKMLKLDLPAFDLVRGLHKYNPGTGDLLVPQNLMGVAAEAQQDGRQLIGLVVLPEDMLREHRDALIQQLGRYGVGKLLTISRDMLNRPRAEYMAWVNVAVKLAQKAGAVPWDVVDLPDVTDNTYFIGVDLGHNHKERSSLPAFTLHEFRGRPVKAVTLPKRSGNERLSLDELRMGFGKLLKGKQPDRVIVHRDGRFLEGEVDDFMIALNELNVPYVSMLAVKKSNLSMASEVHEGAVLTLDDRRCLLVTNTQSAVARPTELEVMHSDGATLATLTEQVFWLTRVFMNNVQHAGSDPCTVEWANGVARTGKRVPLAGWQA